MDTFLTQLKSISPVDWFAMVMGITGVWLSIKEKLIAWPLFILCYCAYIYISFRSGYYAFGGMNIAFVGIAGYGWYKWSRSSDQAEDAVNISHLPRKQWLCIIALLIIGTAAIGTLLSTTGEARLPYYDAFATCCAFIAQWMLSRKHIENWLFWITSDCIYLKFFYTDQIWPSVILFSVFIILAIKGWFEWKGTIAPATSAT